MIAFCTQGDLEIAVGGAAVLAQLADPGHTGQPVQAYIDDYLADGAAVVRASAEIKHDPEALKNLDADSLRRLRNANAKLSARVAYEKGGQGQAMPEWVTSAAEREDKYLENLRLGRERLGRVAGAPAVGINQPAKIVDYDANGTGISVTAMKGGFR